MLSSRQFNNSHWNENRPDERLFKRIFCTGDPRHHERRDGRGGRVLAGSREFRTRAVHSETIFRSAKDGERDPATLHRMALLELQITPRD